MKNMKYCEADAIYLKIGPPCEELWALINSVIHFDSVITHQRLGSVILRTALASPGGWGTSSWCCGFSRIDSYVSRRASWVQYAPSVQSDSSVKRTRGHSRGCETLGPLVPKTNAQGLFEGVFSCNNDTFLGLRSCVCRRLSVIPCRDVHEESVVISFVLRYTLETSGHRTILVRPDPILERGGGGCGFEIPPMCL
jgi:hypothetical protein